MTARFFFKENRQTVRLSLRTAKIDNCIEKKKKQVQKAILRKIDLRLIRRRLPILKGSFRAVIKLVELKFIEFLWKVKKKTQKKRKKC